MPSWSENAAESSIAQVIWTIDWAVAAPPDLSGSPITVGAGEHGSVDDPSSLTTDSEGKVTFPSVTPDQGYKLSHWEDETGATVDGNTVFEGPSTVHSVFDKTPDSSPSS